MITPINGRLLIELKGKYENFEATEERFGTSKTRGILRGIAKNIEKETTEAGLKVGQVVFFGKYEDSAPLDVDEKDHILLKYEDLGGFED